jgi:hypothetical protein
MGEADDAEAGAATSRRLGFDGVKTAASAISTSSPSDEDEVTEAKCALLTGITRVAAAVEAEEEEEARRGRFFFDGVSGSKMPSSSSEADTMSESEKATLTLRFALLVREEGVGVVVVVVKFAPLLASRRIADLVGEADCECDGVLVGVFDVDAGVDAAAAAEASNLAFFFCISLIVARIDSLNAMHSSSINFMRELKSLSEMPCLLANCICCTFESWAGR